MPALARPQTIKRRHFMPLEDDPITRRGAGSIGSLQQTFTLKEGGPNSITTVKASPGAFGIISHLRGAPGLGRASA